MQTNDNSSLEDFLNNAVAQIRINRGSHHKAARKRGEIFVKIQAQLPGEFMRWVKKQNREWETSNNERGFDYSYPNVYNYIVLYKLYEKYPDTYKEFESEGVAKMYRLAKFILNGRTKEEWVREHGVVGSKRKFKLGNEIRFKGLQHAPVNEQGVVYLFALVSEKLGFRVQGIRSEYPDCMAMKR